MLSFLSGKAGQLVRALDSSMAIIEFDPTGSVLKANKNFCDLMGYSEAELIGKHHQIFVDAGYAKSSAYVAFWETLRGGDFQISDFKRISKSGKEIYIRGNYNPIKDRSGKVVRIVKVASDITQSKLNAIESAAKLDAISRAQATIEFAPDGTILTANENFFADARICAFGDCRPAPQDIRRKELRRLGRLRRLLEKAVYRRICH